MRRRVRSEFTAPLWLIKSWKAVLIISGGITLVILLITVKNIYLKWNSVNWFGHEPYRILVLNVDSPKEPVKITLVNAIPDTGNNIFVDIPTQTMLSSVGGLGNYRVGAFYQLGEIEGLGNRLLKDSVGFTLGIPIHQVLEIPENTSTVPWGKVRRQVIEEGLRGKRSLPEAIKVWQLLSKAGNDSGIRLSITEENALRTKPDVDGRMNYYLEQALLDRFVMDNLLTVWKEAALLQVAVINASGKSQMATQWSRLARVGGFDVVNVSDQQIQSETTTLLFQNKDLLGLESAKSLMRLYPKAKVAVGDTSNYRCQAAIILGMDSWKWLNERNEYTQKN